MPLPTRSDVLTLDYTGAGQPAAYIEAKNLSPSSATLDYTLAAQPVFGLASTATNYSITALNGAYTVTGRTVTLLRSRSVIAFSGSYSLNGQSAALSVGRLLYAQNGVYSLSGQSADITYNGGTPVAAAEYFIEIRSFTERRRF